MKVIFTVEIETDDDVVAREGARAGYSLERAREAMLSDLECRLVDSARWRDGVARVGVELVSPVITNDQSTNESKVIC